MPGEIFPYASGSDSDSGCDGVGGLSPGPVRANEAEKEW